MMTYNFNKLVYFNIKISCREYLLVNLLKKTILLLLKKEKEPLLDNSLLLSRLVG